MPQSIKNIFLIEDNKLIQDTLTNTIVSVDDLSLVCGDIKDLMVLEELPYMVLFDIDQQQEKPIESLRKILDIAPSAHVVATSRWMDETLASQMRKTGFSSGIIKPFEKSALLRLISELEEVKAKTHTDKKTLTFFSPKGKSGKTTLIVNLAIALAENTGKSIGIIDADLMFSDISVFVNIEPKSTMAEVVRDLDFLTPTLLANYFEDVTPQVKVLCGIRRPEQATIVNARHITQIINMAKESFDYLLIDTPAGFNPISIAAAEAAAQTYIVAMQNSTFANEDLKRALDIFHSLDDWEMRVHLIMTRVSDINSQVQQELNRAIGHSVFLIPNEYILVSDAANKGRMAKDIKKDSALTQRINLLAADICQAK